MQKGGSAKIVPEYNEPKNNPAVPNESKQMHFQKLAENGAPRETQPIINFQYYQPPRPPKEKGPNMSQYALGPMPMPMPYNPYGGFGMMPGYPQMLMPPIVKNIHITTDGPTADHQRLALIHEDVMPGKPFVPSSTTIGERLNIYQFVRSSIFSNADGNDISLDGTQQVGGANSLLSFIKFGDLNPYNTYKLSPNIYRGMPEGYLIYRTCYPIRESNGSAQCAKDSTGVNVRIYKMLEGSFLVNRINPKLFVDFDEWREVAFYEHIRENVIKKKVCPHFPTLYGYFISEKCGIDFDAIARGMDSTKLVLEGEPLYVNVEDKRDCNNTFDMIETLNDGLQKLTNTQMANASKTVIDNGVLISVSSDGDIAKKREIQYVMPDSTTVSFNQGVVTPAQTHKVMAWPKTNVPSNGAGKTIQYVTSDNTIIEINPNAYTGKTLVLLTESPTYNLVGWATKTYQQSGNVREMINRGIHDENEWMNVLFQTMVGLYVMQINKIFINNFSLENNVLIKDLTVRGAITNFWKYKIDDMDFYLPNLGYLVLIDSNFRDLNNNTATQSESTFNKVPITNTSKLNGKFLGKNCKLSDVEISEKVFEMFANTFNPNVFDKEFDKLGGCKPPGEVMNLMSKISGQIASDKDRDIKKYIIEHMTKYLHNRTGTYLREAEALNIRKEDTREFKKGQVVVFEDGFGTYKFVIYIDTLPDGKAKILTKDDANDADIIENTVAITTLSNYSRAEPIAQNYKPNEANMNEDDLLETYVIKK